MNELERTPFDCNRMRFSNLWYFVTKMPLTFVDGDSPMRTALGGPLFFQSVSPIDWLSQGSLRPDMGLHSIPRQ